MSLPLTQTQPNLPGPLRPERSTPCRVPIGMLGGTASRALKGVTRDDHFKTHKTHRAKGAQGVHCKQIELPRPPVSYKRTSTVVPGCDYRWPRGLTLSGPGV
jgi:hypothetical protein